MFCFLVRTRLYDLAAGNLSGPAAEKIKAHLQGCLNCAGHYREIKQILGLVAQKQAPQPSSQFWANFDQELEQRLAWEKVAPQQKSARRLYLPQLKLKPALALASTFIFLLAVSFYFLGGLPTKSRLTAIADERLVNEIAELEELTGEWIVQENGDFLLDEITFLDELS